MCFVKKKLRIYKYQKGNGIQNMSYQTISSQARWCSVPPHKQPTFACPALPEEVPSSNFCRMDLAYEINICSGLHVLSNI